MRGRPAILVFILLAAGMGAGSHLPDTPPALLLPGALVLAALGLASRSAWSARAAFAGAAIALGMGWWTLRVESTPSHALSRVLSPDSESILTIEGVVRTHPRKREASGAFARFSHMAPGWSFEVEADTLLEAGGRRAGTGGRLLVRVGEGAPEVAPGDLVRLTGRARGVAGPSNPGETDWRRWARQHGRAGTIALPTPSLVERIVRTDESILDRAHRAGLRARGWLLGRALGALRSGPEGGSARENGGVGAGRAIALAMLLGEARAPLQEMRATFARVGLSHMLAISGLHLALLAATTLGALRLLAPAWRFQPLALATVIAVYLVITPANPPVVRAGAMLLGAILAQSAGRRYDQLNTLAWVGVAILLWRPYELVSPGFMLSFLVVAALIALVPRVHRGLLGEAGDPDAFPLRMRLARRVADGAIIAVVAWAISAPVTAWKFGVFPTLGWLPALLLAPLLSAALAVGYLAIGVGLFLPGAGAALGDVSVWLCGHFAGIVWWIEGLPGMTLRAPRVSGWWAAGVTAASAWVFATGVSRAAAKSAVVVGLCVWLWWFVVSASRLPSDVAARLDTLDVGQGACHVLRVGDEALLWDCGSRWSGVGLRAVPEAVRALGVGSTRTAVITHGDVDHFSGLADAAWALGVRRALVTQWLLDSAILSPRGAEAALLAALEEQGVAVETVHAGDALDLGGARVEFLHPPSAGEGVERFRADNDASLVARVAVATAGGERRILLTGDIAREAMRMLADADVACDVLEVPHHGSAIREAYAFVERSSARVVVQSTDRSRLDDPRWAPQRVGRRWLATAREGAISVVIRADGGIEAFCWKPGAAGGEE